jgi:hypothetical protein
VGTVAHLAKARQQRRTWGTLPLSRRFVPPIFALALATLVAVSLLVGETAGLYVLVLAIVILVISAVQDAWGLLVLIGGEERDGTTS